MNKPRVFVTRAIPEEGLNLLRETCQVDVWPGELPPERDAMLQRVRGVDGLLCLLTDRVDAEVIAAAGDSLKVISTYAVGYDNIDVAEATRRGIPVGNTPGVLTDATADLAFALLLAAARRIVEADAYVRAGNWRTWGPKLLLGGDLNGATLGIVGFGRIGQAVARRAAGFGMRILYYHPEAKEYEIAKEIGAQYADLPNLLRESDYVSLHAPLTEATRGLIDAESLRRMKPTAVLVNTARGPMVDTMALYQALKDGLIAYAALDVTDPEPLPADHPLLTLENVIVAPHIGSAGVQTRTLMATMAAENLLAGLRNERLPNCVNPQVYE
jgi:lactate dehydrogenase-like 2-hydroxyacid dehydrogenase